MGLLDSLLMFRGKLDTYAEAGRLSLLEKLGLDDVYLRLNQKATEGELQARAAFADKQLAKMAPGLARQLTRSGMGPQGTVGLLDELGQPTGRRQTIYGNRDAAEAVGLMSDPTTRALGAANAQALLTPGASAARDQAQAVLQGQNLSNIAGAMGITQQGIMGPLQQQQAQASIDASRASTALNRLQLNQLMTAPPSLADKYEALTGAPVPSGYTPEDGPLGIRLRPHEGTDPHKGAVKDVRTAEGVLDLANQYADMVIGSADKPGVGAETWPTAEKGQARFIHGKLIGDMTEMARTGALNEHDLPRLYGMLPSAADKYVWTEADTAALEAFIAELERAVARVHEENWFIKPRTMPGPSDAFPWPMSSGR